MYKVKANPSKKYLYIYLEGFITPQEMIKAIDDAKVEVAKLKDGFTIINDIEKFKPSNHEVAGYISQTQRYMFEKGAFRVIRIIGNNILGKHQWRKTQAQGGAPFEVIEVSSIEEAKKILSETSN